MCMDNSSVKYERLFACLHKSGKMIIVWVTPYRTILKNYFFETKQRICCLISFSVFSLRIICHFFSVI